MESKTWFNSFTKKDSLKKSAKDSIDKAFTDEKNSNAVADDHLYKFLFNAELSYPIRVSDDDKLKYQQAYDAYINKLSNTDYEKLREEFRKAVHENILNKIFSEIDSNLKNKSNTFTQSRKKNLIQNLLMKIKSAKLDSLFQKIFYADQLLNYVNDNIKNEDAIIDVNETSDNKNRYVALFTEFSQEVADYNSLVISDAVDVLTKAISEVIKARKETVNDNKSEENSQKDFMGCKDLKSPLQGKTDTALFLLEKMARQAKKGVSYVEYLQAVFGTFTSIFDKVSTFDISAFDKSGVFDKFSIFGKPLSKSDREKLKSKQARAEYKRKAILKVNNRPDEAINTRIEQLKDVKQILFSKDNQTEKKCGLRVLYDTSELTEQNEAIKPCPGDDTYVMTIKTQQDRYYCHFYFVDRSGKEPKISELDVKSEDFLWGVLLIHDKLNHEINRNILENFAKNNQRVISIARNNYNRSSTSNNPCYIEDISPDLAAYITANTGHVLPEKLHADDLEEYFCNQLSDQLTAVIDNTNSTNISKNVKENVKKIQEKLQDLANISGSYFTRSIVPVAKRKEILKKLIAYVEEPNNVDAQSYFQAKYHIMVLDEESSQTNFDQYKGQHRFILNKKNKQIYYIDAKNEKRCAKLQDDISFQLLIQEIGTKGKDIEFSAEQVYKFITAKADENSESLHMHTAFEDIEEIIQAEVLTDMQAAINVAKILLGIGLTALMIFTVFPAMATVACLAFAATYMAMSIVMMKVMLVLQGLGGLYYSAKNISKTECLNKPIIELKDNLNKLQKPDSDDNSLCTV